MKDAKKLGVSYKSELFGEVVIKLSVYLYPDYMLCKLLAFYSYEGEDGKNYYIIPTIKIHDIRLVETYKTL